MAKRQAAARTASRKTTAKKKAAARPKKPSATTRPDRATPLSEAVDAYERGLDAIRGHDYAAGHRILTDILTNYPGEREIHERVRLYLQLCERHMRTAQAPGTIEELLYAATLALNTGDRARAMDHLTAVRVQDPDNDHALYMLAVLQSLAGDLDASLECLRRAIELNPDNRALARYDPELEAVRSTDGFKLMLDTAGSPARRTRGRRSR